MDAKDIVAKEIARQAKFGYEPSWLDLVIAGQKAGIREVVEWIKEMKETPLGTDPFGCYVWEGELQAKLKEWGIDGD